jgi:hypothetical protein
VRATTLPCGVGPDRQDEMGFRNFMIQAEDYFLVGGASLVSLVEPLKH